MRVLMFGWEFPPHISGGLGTACFGLTKALSEKGVEIYFVVPRLYGDEPQNGSVLTSASGVVTRLTQKEVSIVEKNISIIPIDSSILPYETEESYLERMRKRQNLTQEQFIETKRRFISLSEPMTFEGGYGGNLFDEVARYAVVAASIAKQKEFDVIHAHDWLCYKAGEIAKQISGKPLVVHVHATEFDRSGEGINRRVYEMERQGMEAADKIVCVSEFTRNIVIEKYKQNPQKVVCVHNGAELPTQKSVHMQNSLNKKIVSFIGRITFQKGPDYFVEMAEKVLQKDKDFIFVMAGDGDMLNRMIDLVARKRISENFFFTGFLRGEDMKTMLAMSDVYVMPSVSEPFGIMPLEAMQAGIPTIISRQSGVSEVLRNVIKVDFWDIDEMADAVYALGTQKVLSDTLSVQGRYESESVTWGKAADKLSELYTELQN